MSVEEVDQFVCPQPFVFECHEPSCCDAYYSNVVMLLIGLGIILAGLIVVTIWFFVYRGPFK